MPLPFFWKQHLQVGEKYFDGISFHGSRVFWCLTSPVMLRTKKEREKNAYAKSAITVERGCFTHWVSRFMGREFYTFYSLVFELIATKSKQQQSMITNWIRTKLLFAPVRSLLICLRGSQPPWKQETSSSLCWVQLYRAMHMTFTIKTGFEFVHIVLLKKLITT